MQYHFHCITKSGAESPKQLGEIGPDLPWGVRMRLAVMRGQVIKRG